MWLQVCGVFKSVYFDYKARAATECPDNPWRIQNSALFGRFDRFLERCHDVRELAQTIVTFGHAAAIEVCTVSTVAIVITAQSDA